MWRDTDDRPQDAVADRGADRAELARFSASGEAVRPGVKPPLDNTAKSVGRSDDDFAAKQGRISISGISDMRLDCSAALPASAFAAGR